MKEMVKTGIAMVGKFVAAVSVISFTAGVVCCAMLTKCDVSITPWEETEGGNSDEE